MGNIKNIDERNKNITRASIISIFTNILLATVKVLIGFFTSSIAITLDAVNNLTDSISGLVTLICAKISGKEADSDHPHGHGRIEYISAMIVSGMVLYAGFIAFIQSIKKIIKPSMATYTFLSIFLIGLLILVKLVLYFFIKKQGDKLNSLSLIASAEDAKYDAILSSVVLISIIIYYKTNFYIEAYIALLISILIIRSGATMLIDTINEILGMPLEKELRDEILDYICSLDEKILGSYDLITTSYGPTKIIANVHIVVNDSLSACDIDILSRKIRFKVLKKFNIVITSVGIYTQHKDNDSTIVFFNEIASIVKKHGANLQNHAFYLNTQSKILAFDIDIDYDRKNRSLIFDEILKEIKEKYKDFSIYMNLDI